MDVDEDHGPGRTLLAVLGVLLDELVEMCPRRCGRDHAGASVGPNPPQRVPVVFVVIDEHGYPRSRKVRASGNSAAFTIILDETSAYHVVTR